MTDLYTYQEQARTTAVYPDDMSLIYPAMLAGAESGEMQNKVQKLIRKGVLPSLQPHEVVDPAVVLGIIDECGDQLWALANICSDLNVSFEYCASRNIDKLKSRHVRGVIEGEGDNR